MSPFVLSLDSAEATLPLAGGKGANLAELIRGGFDGFVPPGFVVTTEAYQAFVQANRLEGDLLSLAGGFGMVDRPSPRRQEAAARIGMLFERGEIPGEVTEALTAAYQELCRAADPSRRGHRPDDLPVAVRSSAVLEDRAEASAAGQQATLLNVRGEAGLLSAVRRCWASLWSERAMAYRARRSGDGDLPQLAVVVQAMVPAECAGVLFTANPVNGRLDEILINAGWGLGESVVAGRVTPDTLVVDKATGRVKHLEVGDKDRLTIPSPDGTAEEATDPKRRRQPVLNEKQVAALARLGRDVEAHFGTPQDVEWAIAAGHAYLLQSRPVTTALNSQDGGGEGRRVPGDDRWPAVDERPAQPFDLWTRAVLGEVWPHPVSPLMWSGVPVIIGDSIRYSLRGLRTPYLEKAQLAGRFYGRVYYNEGALATAFSRELGLPASFVNAALGYRRGLDEAGDDRFRPIRFLRRLPFVVRMAMSQLGTGRELEALFPKIEAWTAQHKRLPLDRLSDRELWDEFLRWVERFKRAINLQAEISSVGITAFALLEWLLARWLRRKDLAVVLIGGLPGVYAAEMGPALWRIAQALHDAGVAEVLLSDDPKTAYARLLATPAAGPAMQLLDAFLERHGHRCPNEGEWLRPRWVEAPDGVIEVLAGYLRADGLLDPEAAEARQRERREEATAWAEARLGPVRRFIFRLVLARAQHGARLRDNGKHYYMRLALPIRQIDVLLGERWTERGWLARPEDIFFLTIPDIQRVLESGDPAGAGPDLLERVSERRKAFDHWFDVQPPEVLGPSGESVETARDDFKASVLQGIPASGGQARGAARILVDPSEAIRLGPGDILVTRATDPGWTTLFPLVAGLVVEVGGQLSHAAIVAREYGLPAVVNVHAATRRIRDGQLITVDGTSGRVFLDDGEAKAGR